MGRLPKFMVDIVGVWAITDFEVIEIVEYADPYPALLGLDWAIDMGGVINLKRHTMVFENKGTRVIVPLDPAEGPQFTEPTYEKEELDHIYKITAQDEDQVNPTYEGMLCWEKDNESFSDFDEELENWQGRLHEVSTLRSLWTIRNFCCISTTERTSPYQEDAGEYQ